MVKLDKKSLNIDYYGIISVLSDEIGITRIIDELVNNHHNQTVTTGEAVKGILLNMLAIFMRPLYLTSEFFNDKPVDRLIHPRLTADNFTDDVLGAALDRLYDHGLEELFLAVSSQVMLHYPQYLSPLLHGDTTTMSVYGGYEGESEEGIIEITRGYSRDHRPDLKQFVISMVTCGRLPVFLTTLSGNTSDRKHFRELIAEYGNQMKQAFTEDKTFVFDSAFYNKLSIQGCGTSTKWISRVGERITEAKQLVEETEKFVTTTLEGYKITGLPASYGGVEQRWVVVESAKAYRRERRNLEKYLSRQRERIDKQIWHLSKQLFASKECACREAKKLVKNWKYHTIVGDLDKPSTIHFETVNMRKNGKRGRPKNGEKLEDHYRITLKAELSEELVSKAFAAKGRFVLATNNLDLTDEAILRSYKEQQNVERGFRFLKDPMFFVDGIYLKHEHRIMAMAMIMGLALLVYSLAEKKIRARLDEANENFQDRYRKRTKRPTIRRVLQTWSGIHVWYISLRGKVLEESVVNLKEENQQILRLLGPSYQRMYKDGESGDYPMEEIE